MIDELEAVLNDPNREIAVEDESPADIPGEETGHTIKMPAIKMEIPKEADEKQVEQRIEKDTSASADTKKNNKKKPAPAADIDKKKEKKVITIAIVCAILVIALISTAFLSLSGLGGMLIGSETVEIPDLDGMLYEEAIEKYVETEDENAEYKFNIIRGKAVESKLEKDTILSQDPEAGSKVKKKEVIVVTVELSAGSSEIKLKNYIRYQDSRDVEIEMNELGLKAEFEEEFSDTIPTGSIIRQEPAAGTSVNKGDKIVFYVSKGPEDGEKKEEDEPKNSGTEDEPSNQGGSNGR